MLVSSWLTLPQTGKTEPEKVKNLSDEYTAEIHYREKKGAYDKTVPMTFDTDKEEFEGIIPERAKSGTFRVVFHPKDGSSDITTGKDDFRKPENYLREAELLLLGIILLILLSYVFRRKLKTISGASLRVSFVMQDGQSTEYLLGIPRGSRNSVLKLIIGKLSKNTEDDELQKRILSECQSNEKMRNELKKKSLLIQKAKMPHGKKKVSQYFLAEKGKKPSALSNGHGRELFNAGLHQGTFEISAITITANYKNMR